MKRHEDRTETSLYIIGFILFMLLLLWLTAGRTGIDLLYHPPEDQKIDFTDP